MNTQSITHGETLNCLDTDNPAAFSAAAREQAERRDGLLEAIEQARTDAAAKAGTMIKAELLAAIGETERSKVKKNATVAELTALYARLAAEATPEYEELTRLNTAAGADRYVAMRLNRTADDYAAAAAKVRGASDPAYGVEWCGSDLMTAKYLLRYADHVRAAIANEGLDIREAALEIAKSAMWEVLAYARNNGLRLNGHGLDEAAAAKAATEFLRLVTPVLPDSVPVSMITD